MIFFKAGTLGIKLHFVHKMNCFFSPRTLPQKVKKRIHVQIYRLGQYIPQPAICGIF